MGTVSRWFAAVALLVGAAAAAAAAQSLEPEWSRPVGGTTRLVGVEEYGRCSVFVDNGVLQVVAPSGGVTWNWPFRKVSKYINPGDVAVAHDCDAIALVGDSSYKYVWIVQALWHRYAAIEAFISARGERFLASVDRVQEKKEADFFGGPHAGADVQLLSREGTVIATFDDYLSPIALSDDGSRMWLRAADHVACVDEKGNVRSRIDGEVSFRGVTVSRDFGQVLIVREKDLTPVMVERYEVSKSCRP